MPNSLDALIRDLKKFDDSREVVRQLRKEIRKPVPVVRKAIRRRALTTLPKGGGLNKWVAATRITAQVKLSGRSAGVRLRGGRNSTGSRSDIRAIDRGRVRAPTYGRRNPNSWHTVKVPAGFFTRPTTETDEWRKSTLAAVDKALDTIRRGG